MGQVVTNGGRHTLRNTGGKERGVRCLEGRREGKGREGKGREGKEGKEKGRSKPVHI